MEKRPAQPIILTLALDARLFEVLNTLRTRHFPPERLFVPAHITLFHALPSEREDVLRTDLCNLCAMTSPFTLELLRPRSLGRGVALQVESPALMALRGRLARKWWAWLTPQDRQSYRPHVTIQNKVAKEEARALLATLTAEWRPLAGQAEGLEVWRYAGGPWLEAGAYRFARG